MGNRETWQGGPTLSNSLTMADITSGSQHLLVGPGSSLRIGLSLLIPEAAINQLEICRCRIRCFLRLYFLTDIFSIYKCNGFVSLLKFILLKKIICSYSLEGDDNFQLVFLIQLSVFSVPHSVNGTGVSQQGVPSKWNRPAGNPVWQF